MPRSDADGMSKSWSAHLRHDLQSGSSSHAKAQKLPPSLEERRLAKKNGNESMGPNDALWESMKQAMCGKDAARISLMHRCILLLDFVPSSRAGINSEPEEWQLETLRNVYVNQTLRETRLAIPDENLLRLVSNAAAASSADTDNLTGLLCSKLEEIHELVDEVNSRVLPDAFKYTRTIPSQQQQERPSADYSLGGKSQDSFGRQSARGVGCGETDRPNPWAVGAAAGTDESRKRRAVEHSFYGEDGESIHDGSNASAGGYHRNGHGNMANGGWAAAGRRGETERGQGMRHNQGHQQPPAKGGRAADSRSSRTEDDGAQSGMPHACSVLSQPLSQ
jgi:hypothetical protein